MLLFCIYSYLKSAVRYKHLIWIPIIRTLYIYVNKDVSLFFEAKVVSRAKMFGKHWSTDLNNEAA